MQIISVMVITILLCYFFGINAQQHQLKIDGEPKSLDVPVLINARENDNKKSAINIVSANFDSSKMGVICYLHNDKVFDRDDNEKIFFAKNIQCLATDYTLVFPNVGGSDANKYLGVPGKPGIKDKYDTTWKSHDKVC